MAQSVKMLDAKPDNLCSVSRTHMVEGKDWPSKLSSDLCLHTVG